MKKVLSRLTIFVCIFMCINVKYIYADPQVGQVQESSLILEMYNFKEVKINAIVENLEKDKLVLTSIIAVLFLMLDNVIESILKRFTKVNKSIHVIKVLLPFVVFTLVNCMCFISSENDFYTALSYGVCLKPKTNTIMNWAVYLNIWILIIGAIVTVYNLFRNYSLLASIIKMVEAGILYLVLNVVLAAVGKKIMTGIICVVLLILVFSTILNSRAKEEKK